MRGKTTFIIDEEGNEWKFAFDHSFWSHDEYNIDSEGVFIPEGDKYSD